MRQAGEDFGWVSTMPQYCQLIREANKKKHLKRCEEMRDSKETSLSQFGKWMTTLLQLTLQALWPLEAAVE